MVNKETKDLIGPGTLYNWFAFKTLWAILSCLLASFHFFNASALSFPVLLPIASSLVIKILVLIGLEGGAAYLLSDNADFINLDFL